MVNKWLFNKITDYFDSQDGKNNIYEFSNQIGTFPDEVHNEIYADIADRIMDYYDAVMKLYPMFLEACGFEFFDSYTMVSEIIKKTGAVGGIAATIKSNQEYISSILEECVEEASHLLNFNVFWKFSTYEFTR